MWHVLCARFKDELSNLVLVHKNLNVFNHYYLFWTNGINEFLFIIQKIHCRVKHFFQGLKVLKYPISKAHSAKFINQPEQHHKFLKTV